MEKNKTAINWLVDQIKSEQNQKTLSASEWMEVIEQAKQMEKEQIVKAATYDPFLGELPRKEGEHYYKKTYAHDN